MRTRLDLTFTVAASTALLLAGCQRQSQSEWTAGTDTAVCRDGQGRRADDSLRPQRASGHATAAVAGAYGWWYLSRGSRVPAVGSAVVGGAATPVAGHSYAHAASSISRGGFGFSSRAGG